MSNQPPRIYRKHEQRHTAPSGMDDTPTQAIGARVLNMPSYDDKTIGQFQPPGEIGEAAVGVPAETTRRGLGSRVLGRLMNRFESKQENGRLTGNLAEMLDTVSAHGKLTKAREDAQSSRRLTGSERNLADMLDKVSDHGRRRENSHKGKR